MEQNEIDERSFKVLRDLVDAYIQEGQPVGSKALAERSGLKLSSATIRNIMSDLESAGLLVSPHTSSGRIPTQKGYRLFVNHLLTTKESEFNNLEQMRKTFFSDVEEEGLIGRASTVLSQITQLAGIVTLPKPEQMIVKQIEFLRLSEKRILVILVFQNYEVQNRVIETDRDFSRLELEQAGNYLTHYFSGQDLLKAREAIVRTMQNRRKDLEAMLQSIMEIAEENEEKNAEKQYVLAGESNLLGTVNSSDYYRLQTLFEAFSEKRDVLHLLDRCLEAEGVQIFIGKESGYEVFNDYSVVSAPYSVNGVVVGVMGVIGLTRMPYERVISAVDLTSKLLSHSLEH